MSLITDKVFYNALLSNSELVAAVGDRIENTSIPVPDEEFKNEPLPYIIITFDGLQNEGYTMDNSYEGDTDKVQISIEVQAEDRETLGELTEVIRKTVISYFENVEPSSEDYELVPDDYTFSASQISYDPDRPCYGQILTYNCDTTP